MKRYLPLATGMFVTSPFGDTRGRPGPHTGVDFGFPGGSGGRPVYAIQSGTVIHAGAASGYGGPDPAGWLVVDSTDAEGGGCLEYGHILRRCNKGDHIEAGQIIAEINPNQKTNGGVAPHLHLSDMPGGYDPGAKQDPMRRLKGAIDPTATNEPGRAPVVLPPIKGVDPNMGDPLWLADVIRPAVTKFVEYPGWRDRGHGDFKDIRGVMVHHTGGPASAASIANGRPDLAGPLSQLHIARDGTVTVVAVGVAWHAGSGSYPWLPTNMGNWHLIGIECEWPYRSGITERNQGDERWKDPQVIALRDTCAALLLKLGYRTDRLIGHKDYAGRAQGKWDPGNMSMQWLRDEVDKDMRGMFGGPLPPAPPPPVVLPPAGGYAHILIFRGQTGSAVTALQTRLKRNYSKLPVDGVFGDHTERCVRDYQATRKPPLVVDGIVGPATAAALGLVI